jgi:hypothetical protein
MSCGVALGILLSRSGKFKVSITRYIDSKAPQTLYTWKNILKPILLKRKLLMKGFEN